LGFNAESSNVQSDQDRCPYRRGSRSAPAQAQYYLGLGLETNIELTNQDLAIIRQTVDGQMHGKPVGTTAK
jgi:hypothetical protein